jgi:hypothetical protein
VVGGTPFVGREREVAALRERLVRARVGQGGLALISGDAGIGKTRLLDEFAAQAIADGCSVRRGGCVATGAAPFAPWRQVLGGTVTLESEPAADAGLPPRYRLFAAAATALRALAVERPLLIVLDDMQWADFPSLLLVQHLADEIADWPALLLLAARDSMASKTEARAALLDAIAARAGTLTLPLDGLDEHAVARYLDPDGRNRPPLGLIAEILRQSSGNPFQVAQALQAQARSAPEQPSRWQAAGGTSAPALAQRLAHLSDNCRGILTVAAVLGRDFSTRAVAATSERARDDLSAGLAEAEGFGLVEHRPDAPDRFHFTHDLIRETLYARLREAGRARLHWRAAQALAEADTAAPELLAHHFLEGAPFGDGTRAAQAGLRAARQAYQALAYESAALLAEQALAALAEASETVLRCDLLLTLGDALAAAGEAERARASFLQAAAQARAAGDAERLAAAALGYAGRGVTAAAPEQLRRALLEDALAALPKQATAVRARLLARLAQAVYWTGSLPEALALSIEAERLGRAVADPATLAHCLYARRYVLWGPDDAVERPRLTEEAFALATAAGESDLALLLRRWQICDALETADRARFEFELAEHARVAALLRRPYDLWLAEIYSAQRALLDGDLADAERLIQAGLALGMEAHATDAQLTFALQLVALRWEQGRLGEIAPFVEQATAQFGALPLYRALAALLAGESDDSRRVEALLAAALNDGIASFPRDATWLPTLIVLAHVCARAGISAQAALVETALTPYAGRLVVGGNGIALLGPVDYALGLLATRRQDHATAFRCFSAARSSAEAAGARSWAARARAGAAAAQLTGGGPAEQARADLRRVLSEAESLGLAPLAAFCRATLAADRAGDR